MFDINQITRRFIHLLRSSLRNPRPLSLILCSAVIPLSGANCPVIVEIPARVKYVISMSRDHAAGGENVTINWAFDNEIDANGNSRIESQSVEFIGHSVIRVDVPPPQFELDRCARTIDFTFAGPVTVDLKAKLTDGGEISAAVDVLVEEDLFANANVRPANEDYPRLGLLFPQGSFQQGDRIAERHLVFTEFAAIIDKNNDGLIDQFAQIPELQAFLSREDDFRAFSLHVDRVLGVPIPGTSLPCFEIVDPDNGEKVFRFSQGLRFPLLPADLQSSLQRTRCDMIILAGAIVYGGTLADAPKLENGDNPQPVIEDAFDFDPVFVMIDVVDLFESFVIADVHIGNLKQGLICSLHRGLDDALDQDARREGEIDITGISRPSDANPVGNIKGNIKGAFVAETVRTVDDLNITSPSGGQNVVGAYVSFDFNFSMPLVNDDNIVAPGTIPGPDENVDFTQQNDPNCE